MKYTYLFFVLIFSTTLAFSQNKPWKEQGNNVNNSAFIGTTNNKPLKFKTNNQLRMKIKKNGKVVVKDSMNIEGSLIVNDYIYADSLHVLKRIKIGNSLFVGGLQTGTSEDIFTDDWDLFIQCDGASSNLNTILNAVDNTGFVGIGTETPTFKLEVNNDINLTSPVHNHGYRIGGVVVLQAPALRKYFVHII